MKKSLYKYLAKVTIELTTPLHIGNSNSDDLTDSPVLLDQNGLPTIPGSSIAGVLRSEFRNPEMEKRLFGYQEDDQGKSSSLNVSWASIHNSHDIPQEGILSPDAFNDSVIVLAMKSNSKLRDHVRINHRGASDSQDTDGESGHGKFDEAIVCTGNRFSFELEFSTYDKSEGDPIWEELLKVLHKPILRFGGRSRRGFGAFKIIRCQKACFNLSKQFDAYTAALGNLDNYQNLENYPNPNTPPNNEDANYRTISIDLIPENYWMFGGGIDNYNDQAKLAPVKEEIIVWNDNHGSIQNNNIVIPASSVKGALSHRIAYHYNLLTQNWAETGNGKVGDKNDAVKALFGYCKNKKPSEGARGKVLINDVYIAQEEISQKLINHVSIDRFTGGAKPGMLFTERPVCSQTGFTLRILIENDVLNAENDTTNNIKEALRRTIMDLANGRLQLGAGSGRGNGYFRAEIPENLLEE